MAEIILDIICNKYCRILLYDWVYYFVNIPYVGPKNPYVPALVVVADARDRFVRVHRLFLAARATPHYETTICFSTKYFQLCEDVATRCIVYNVYQ